MSENDAVAIRERLTRLEEKVDQKWDSHDKRADERWADLMEKFHEMAKKLEHRPCAEHSDLMINLKHRTESIEKWQNTINWAVGVVYIAIVGAVVKILVG